MSSAEKSQTNLVLTVVAAIVVAYVLISTQMFGLAYKPTRAEIRHSLAGEEAIYDPDGIASQDDDYFYQNDGDAIPKNNGAANRLMNGGR